MATILVLLVSILLGMTVMFLMYGIFRSASKTSELDAFKKSIEEINKSELEEEKKKEDYIDTKTWSGYWLHLFLNTGRTPTSPEQPGNLAIIAIIVVAAIGCLVWPRDLLAGIMFAVGILAVMRWYYSYEAKKRMLTLQRQLPLLISGIRANLQANQTPQAALEQVAEELPSPLGDELRIMKAELQVSVPLEEALTRLAERVPSRDIQFLVSAIKIAVTSGADLDPQLAIIQTIVDNRTRLQQKLASAIASVNPTIWVSAVTIPGMFIFQFFSNDTNRAFWFSLVGIVCLIAVTFLYGIGLFISKKLVNGVENA